MKVALEYDLAKRMRSATRWVEGQQGIPSPDEVDTADGFGRMMLVRTGALPTGYTGTMGVPGTIIDQGATGVNTAGVAVLIKDVNGGTLSANTNYSARLGGYDTGKALYFVALGSAKSENHFFPFNVRISEQNSKWIAEKKYYRFVSPLTGYGAAFSVFRGFVSPLVEAVSIRLFLRLTGGSVTWSSTEALPVYEWYHVPQVLEIPFVINRPGTVQRYPVADLSPVIRVVDPAPILTYDSGIRQKVSCTCMVQLIEPEYFSYELRIDSLWIIGKTPDIPVLNTISAPLGAL